jgi:hypothetical protein
MSRTALPFHADDISAVARHLRQALAEREAPPSHVELLNILSRAAGYRNFQHFRADGVAKARLAEEPPAPEPVDHVRVLRLARQFDAHGRLMRWPTRRAQQEPCIWVLWSRLPPNRTLREQEINELLNDEHTFGDYALLRRELCNLALLWRPADGSAYRRVERKPPIEVRTLIRHLAPYRARRAAP